MRTNTVQPAKYDCPRQRSHLALEGAQDRHHGMHRQRTGRNGRRDYGYVGAGRGKISLYKQKECIEKNIPEEEAVEKLIELIKANGDYEEKTSSLSSPKEKEDK